VILSQSSLLTWENRFDCQTLAKGYRAGLHGWWFGNGCPLCSPTNSTWDLNIKWNPLKIPNLPSLGWGAAITVQTWTSFVSVDKIFKMWAAIQSFVWINASVLSEVGFAHFSTSARTRNNKFGQSSASMSQSREMQQLKIGGSQSIFCALFSFSSSSIFNSRNGFRYLGKDEYYHRLDAGYCWWGSSCLDWPLDMFEFLFRDPVWHQDGTCWSSLLFHARFHIIADSGQFIVRTTVVIFHPPS
jgi:hypothetical protein